MKISFTLEQFLEVFKNYNQTVFPMQLIIYFMAAAFIYFIFRPSNKSDKIISGICVWNAFYFTWSDIFDLWCVSK
jgi:hypothetical protein